MTQRTVSAPKTPRTSALETNIRFTWSNRGIFKPPYGILNLQCHHSLRTQSHALSLQILFFFWAPCRRGLQVTQYPVLYHSFAIGAPMNRLFLASAASKLRFFGLCFLTDAFSLSLVSSPLKYDTLPRILHLFSPFRSQSHLLHLTTIRAPAPYLNPLLWKYSLVSTLGLQDASRHSEIPYLLCNLRHPRHPSLCKSNLTLLGSYLLQFESHHRHHSHSSATVLYLWAPDYAELALFLLTRPLLQVVTTVEKPILLRTRPSFRNVTTMLRPTSSLTRPLFSTCSLWACHRRIIHVTAIIVSRLPFNLNLLSSLNSSPSQPSCHDITMCVPSSPHLQVYLK